MFGERLTKKDFIIDDVISNRLDDKIDELQTMVKDIEDEYEINVYIYFEWDYKK